MEVWCAIHGGSQGALVTSTHWMGRATTPTPGILLLGVERCFDRLTVVRQVCQCHVLRKGTVVQEEFQAPECL